MILSDKEGQAMLDELQRHIESIYLNEWERTFLDDLSYKGLRFFLLSNKQKEQIARIFDDRITNG